MTGSPRRFGHRRTIPLISGRRGDPAAQPVLHSALDISSPRSSGNPPGTGPPGGGPEGGRAAALGPCRSPGRPVRGDGFGMALPATPSRGAALPQKGDARARHARPAGAGRRGGAPQAQVEVSIRAEHARGSDGRPSTGRPFRCARPLNCARAGPAWRRPRGPSSRCPRPRRSRSRTCPPGCGRPRYSGRTRTHRPAGWPRPP